MNKLTEKLNAFFSAYQCATKEEEKKCLMDSMKETIEEIATLIMDLD